MMLNIDVSDFIVKIGEKSSLDLGDEFSIIAINDRTAIYYIEARGKLSHNLYINSEVIEIKLQNPLFPVYIYNGPGIQIISSNYKFYFDTNLHLQVDELGILEFIIFNTTLEKNTIHKEIRRLFKVESIKVNNCDVIFKYCTNKNYSVGIKELFFKNIDYHVSKTQQDKHGFFLSGGNESRINVGVGNFFNLNRKYITWGNELDEEFYIASKIAQKSKIEHIGINPDVKEIPYDEFLSNCGFLSNMIYGFRYYNVKFSFDQYGFDHIWTGWGDNTGYIPLNQPTEFFSDIFWDYTLKKTLSSEYWNTEFLNSYDISRIGIQDQTQGDQIFKEYIFRFYSSEIAPRIYGQVLNAESKLGNVIAPWFDYDIYEEMQNLEKRQQSLFKSKISRVIWKNNLYYNILRKYHNRLNYSMNSKHYYPILFSDRIKYIGLGISFFLSKTIRARPNFLNPIFDSEYVENELTKILDSPTELFNIEEVEKLLGSKNEFKSKSLFEIFKLIQINKVLQKK